MPIQILEQLFDSSVKARLLKLFLRNPEKVFQIKEAAQRIRSDARLVRKQINALADIGFLRCKKIRQKLAKKIRRKARKIKKIKRIKKNIIKVDIYYCLNPKFEFFNELSNLVLKSSPASKEKILKNIQKLGRIKLALIAGVFLNADNSRTDLLLVGDINKRGLKTFLSNLEAEVGREIAYSVMNIKEFNYRYHMFDRFIRDILEKPHEKLINKLKF